MGCRPTGVYCVRETDRLCGALDRQEWERKEEEPTLAPVSCSVGLALSRQHGLKLNGAPPGDHAFQPSCSSPVRPSMDVGPSVVHVEVRPLSLSLSLWVLLRFGRQKADTAGSVRTPRFEEVAA